MRSVRSGSVARWMLAINGARGEARKIEGRQNRINVRFFALKSVRPRYISDSYLPSSRI